MPSSPEASASRLPGRREGKSVLYTIKMKPKTLSSAKRRRAYQTAQVQRNRDDRRAPVWVQRETQTILWRGRTETRLGRRVNYRGTFADIREKVYYEVQKGT